MKDTNYQSLHTQKIKKEKEKDNLKSFMSMKEIESNTEYLPRRKILIPHGFSGEFYQIF